MLKNRFLAADLAAIVGRIGRRRALDILRVHRSTLARWCAGRSRPPSSALAALRLVDDGRLPGMGDDWYGFRFAEGRLWCPGGRHSYTAAQVEGWHYQEAAYRALQAHCAKIERQLIEAIRDQVRETANDRYANPQDVRARAFR